MKKHFNNHVAPYDRTADIRQAEYDGMDPAVLYRELLAHLPPAGAAVLDVGAGSGRDALWLEKRGYHVVAVEPAPAFRAIIAEKKKQQDAANLDIRDGMLPVLDTLHPHEKFDLILLGAVWQHVPPKSRKDAFNKMAAHLKTGGMIYISLREGPVPAGRKMYTVSHAAATRMARASGLSPVDLPATAPKADIMGRDGVRWVPFAAQKR